MNGEPDFTESLERRVGLLEGLDENVLQESPSVFRSRPAPAVLTLRSLDYWTAILSGGFTYFATSRNAWESTTSSQTSSRSRRQAHRSRRRQRRRRGARPPCESLQSVAPARADDRGGRWRERSTDARRGGSGSFHAKPKVRRASHLEPRSGRDPLPDRDERSGSPAGLNSAPLSSSDCPMRVDAGSATLLAA